MSITQRYWLTWAPGLILAGFLGGVPGFAVMFLPSYLAYYGHKKEWSLGRFTVVACGVAILLFFIATSH